MLHQEEALRRVFGEDLEGSRGPFKTRSGVTNTENDDRQFATTPAASAAASAAAVACLLPA